MLNISPINNNQYNRTLNFKSKNYRVPNTYEKLVKDIESVTSKTKEETSVKSKTPFWERLVSWITGSKQAKKSKLKRLSADKKGWTDLHYFCKDGNVEAVKKILANNPDLDINQLTKRELSYIYLAKLYGHEEIVNLLADIKTLDLSQIDFYKFNDLHYLCRDGYAEGVRRIVKNHPDFDVNQRARKKYSYMYLAEYNGYTDIVYILSGVKGLDLSKTDRKGYNDLHYLCRDGYTAGVRRIISNQPNFDVNQRTKKGESYISLAKSNGHDDIANILAEFI